jgi:hypothetical protein
MRRREHQSGFSTVAILLIVLVIGIVGATGFFVYQHNRPKLSNAASNPSQPSSQQTTTPTPTPPASTVAYLTIKEWGVKLPLSDAIKDAYYTPAVGSSKGPDGQPNTLLLGLRSLDSSGCAATNTTAFAQIFRALPTERDGVTGKLLTQEYPDGVTIGNYFYAYEGVSNTGTCKAPQATSQAADAAFRAAQKGMSSATAN